MAQKRHTEYLSDDDSFQFNSFLIGLITSGLYRGFDFTATNNLFLQLNHDTTGYKYPKRDGSISANTGVVRSKQGVLITEDTFISLQVNANTTAFPRIDLVVCEHKYAEIAGGLDAEYFIIQGTPNANPVVPTLTNPNFQVVIGQLYLPANTSTLDADGVVYTRPQLPELGNNNLQEQVSTLQENFDTLNSTVTNFITTIQNQFNTLNQTMADWRDYYQPQMDFDGVYIEWKYAGEADDQAIWRDLSQGIITNASGPGEMEVRILEAQYLPNAEIYDPANPTLRDHNVLEFNTDTNLPNPATFFINNRIWVAPQTRDYQFLLDTLNLVCKADLDYATLDTDTFPFAWAGSKVWWPASADTTNGFIRFELIKNGNEVAYELTNRFNIEDGTLAGDTILLPVIDEIISTIAGDMYQWRVSIMPNYTNPDEFIPLLTPFPAISYNPQGLVAQANTSFILKEHFDIGTGHWTITPMP